VAIANEKCEMKSSLRLGLEEIARFPLVLLRSGFCTRELIDREFERYGMQAQRYSASSDPGAQLPIHSQIPAVV
jgi:hypothetical protein